jgi:acyl dehydratase
MIEGWQADAFNQVPESENEIHGDAVARRYGFRGGLVPGVTVSAYLMHPAAVAWGMDWLERGAATAVVKKPLYDGTRFRVEVSPSGERAYAATLHDAEGTLVAEGSVRVTETAVDPPLMRGDARVQRDYERPRVSRAVMEQLRKTGMRAVPSRFSEEAELTGYLRNPEAMANPYRPSGGRFASPAFLLGVTNWALSANVYLPAWLHLQTEHQSFAPVPSGSELVTELAVADLFEKKGHEFVDLDLATFFADGRPVMSARLRAIYHLRGS